MQSIETSATELEEQLNSFPTKDPNQPDIAPDEQAYCDGLSRSFRHSFWVNRRKTVENALLMADVPYKQLTRFRQCGSSAFVYRSETNPDKLRIQCDRCKSRWCEACARERRIIIQRNLREHYPPGRTRFLTLTIKSHENLDTATKHLFESWNKLRRMKQYKKSILGGIWFLEVTRNLKTKEWHPHLHVLFTGKYLPQTELSKHWHNITGNSFIVDVREVKNPEVACGYVTKYASKSLPREVWSDSASMTELIRDYAHQKFIGVFGTWRGLKLTAIPASEEGWMPVAPLAKLVAWARQGLQWACETLNALGRYVPTSGDHAPADHTEFDDDLPF